METKIKLPMAVFAGVMIGVGIGGGVTRARAIQSAQVHTGSNLPKAGAARSGYVIAEVDVHDPALMQQYGEKVPETLASFNHHYVIRSSKIQVLEGEPPKGGIVMIAFDNVEKAREWYDSPKYAAIRPIRQKAANSRIFIVEGLPTQ